MRSFLVLLLLVLTNSAFGNFGQPQPMVIPTQPMVVNIGQQPITGTFAGFVSPKDGHTPLQIKFNGDTLNTAGGTDGIYNHLELNSKQLTALIDGGTDGKSVVLPGGTDGFSLFLKGGTDGIALALKGGTDGISSIRYVGETDHSVKLLINNSALAMEFELADVATQPALIKAIDQSFNSNSFATVRGQ